MLAKNTVLKIGDGATPSETFTQIPYVTTLDWDGATWASVDRTNRDNATPVRSIATTIASNGSIKIKLDPWTPGNAQHQLLRTLSLSGDEWNFELNQVASAEDASFSGFIQSFKPITDIAQHLAAEITILVNGVFSI